MKNLNLITPLVFTTMIFAANTFAQNDLTNDEWSMNGLHIVTTPDFSDRVGIGTQNPTAKLHITDVDPDEEALLIFRDQTGVLVEGSYEPLIDFSYDYDNLGATENEPVFFINEDGQTGMGTRSPEGQLHILKPTYQGTNFENYLFKIESENHGYTNFGVTSNGVTHVGLPYSDASVTQATRALFEVWGTDNTALDMTENYLSSFRNWAGDGRVMRLKGGWAHSSNYTPIFQVEANGEYEENVRFRILANGKVAVGALDMDLDTDNDYLLYVETGILTEKVKVAVKNSTDWSDFVFTQDYKLRSLSEVSTYIDNNGHLPDVPSAEDMVQQGLDVAKMDALLLQKIEELTLYVIELNNEIDRLKNEANATESNQH
tara:strand:- start:1598 stop:2719 length:1122 start_codon:yes stop_codon:yes gene_type:complete